MAHETKNKNKSKLMIAARNDATKKRKSALKALKNESSVKKSIETTPCLSPKVESKTKKPRIKRKKTIQSHASTEKRCTNVFIPYDLLYDVIKHVSSVTLLKLSHVSKYYRDFVIQTDENGKNKATLFKRYTKLNEIDSKVMIHHFKSVEAIPWMEMALSHDSQRCIGCQTHRYVFLFNHLPQFYVCHKCCKDEKYLRSVCKSSVTKEYFLTSTIINKNNIDFRSFFVTNPHYKNSSEMQLFWLLEIEFYAHMVWGGADGFRLETEKRLLKREKMKVKRFGKLIDNDQAFIYY